MKINAKAYRSFNDSEPIEIQEIDGRTIEIYAMNESPYLSQYVPRGRFYFWTSDGKGYRLVVERGFYEHVSYFFSDQINGIWVNFLEDLSKTYSKSNKLYFVSTIGIIAALMILAAIIIPQHLVWIFVGGMIFSIVANAVYSKKMSKIVHDKNLKAQDEIREALTDEGFERLLNEQQAYMGQYFKSDEDEDELDSEENLIQHIEQEDGNNEIEVENDKDAE